MHTHQSVQRIFFVPDTFPDLGAQAHPVGIPALYKKQHPRMKFTFLPSRVHFSPHSRKSISCVDSRTLCAFWQQAVTGLFREGAQRCEMKFETESASSA